MSSTYVMKQNLRSLRKEDLFGLLNADQEALLARAAPTSKLAKLSLEYLTHHQTYSMVRMMVFDHHADQRRVLGLPQTPEWSRSIDCEIAKDETVKKVFAELRVLGNQVKEEVKKVQEEERKAKGELMALDDAVESLFASLLKGESTNVKFDASPFVESSANNSAPEDVNMAKKSKKKSQPPPKKGKDTAKSSSDSPADNHNTSPVSAPSNAPSSASPAEKTLSPVSPSHTNTPPTTDTSFKHTTNGAPGSKEYHGNTESRPELETKEQPTIDSSPDLGSGRLPSLEIIMDRVCNHYSHMPEPLPGSVQAYAMGRAEMPEGLDKDKTEEIMFMNRLMLIHAHQMNPDPPSIPSEDLKNLKPEAKCGDCGGIKSEEKENDEGKDDEEEDKSDAEEVDRAEFSGKYC